MKYQVSAHVLKYLEERERLKKLSNQELVAACLNSDAADFILVEEMMDRICPGWEDDKALMTLANDIYEKVKDIAPPR